MGAYQLKITINDSRPSIWRRVIVPDKITFDDLHEMIQTVFCWRNHHLHEFEFPQMSIRVVSDMGEEGDDWYPGDTLDSDRLIDDYVRTGEKFFYTYDFGDNWEHTRMICYRGHTPAELTGIAVERPVFGKNQ